MTYFKVVTDYQEDTDDMGRAKFKVERKCEICGKSFMAKTLTSKYCSKNCSQAAYRQRKKEEEEFLLRKQKVARIPQGQAYLSIANAIVIFDIGRDVLYRLIHDKTVRNFNSGQRMTKVCRSDLEERFNLKSFDERKRVVNEIKTYHLELEDYYTIGETARRFKAGDSTVYLRIRRYSIPVRQIGNYVYAPKLEVDQLYK